MRRGGCIVFLLVVLIALIVVGYYRGWYTVNKAPIQKDEQTIKEKAKQVGQDVKNSVNNALNKNKPAEAPKK